MYLRHRAKKRAAMIENNGYNLETNIYFYVITFLRKYGIITFIIIIYAHIKIDIFTITFI